MTAANSAGVGPKGRPHTWTFFRAGGFDQVRLDSGADLLALDQLDQKLWVALSCPTRGIEFDVRTLDLIDTDKDGRLHVPEVLAAVKWAASMLKSADQLVAGSAALPLDAIDDSTPQGKQVASSARQILINLGKKDAREITVEDTTDTTRIFAQTNFNGDGIIPEDAAQDAAVKGVLADIIKAMGSEPDRSGKPGISLATVEKFYAQAQAYADWWGTSEKESATVMCLGEKTAGAAAALKAVRSKVDDYFARCRLAAFDARAQAALNRQESEYLLVAAKDLTIDSQEVAGFPLSRIEAGRPLTITEAINPAWAAAIGRFREEVVKPILGEKAKLTEGEWAAIVAKFTAYDAWCASKAGVVVEPLGIERVRAVLGNGSRDAILKLIEQDKALEGEASAIATVDKLVRYNRDLIKLLNNFVSFRDFYGRRDKASFQVGTLYLDQRACELCVRVDDMGKHAAMAQLSRTCLIYCEVTRKKTGEKLTIAAALTAGDSDYLMVGRNGLFYDRKGDDFHATITKIIDNPISLAQAFWAPYKRALRWVEDQMAKRAAAADAAAHDRLTTTISDVGSAAETGKPAAPPGKLDIGVVAAIGVAVGGIAAALGALLQAFFGLGIWMPLGFVAILVLISGPSLMIAWLKLRQRNLGPILDANGWAVNAKARINIPFGGALTSTAKLPRGSTRDLRDPYADRRIKPVYVFFVAIVLTIAAWLSWKYAVAQEVAVRVFPSVIGNPVSGADIEAQSRGAMIFAETCAKCHGADGRGVGDTKSMLDPRVGQMSDGQIYKAIIAGHQDQKANFMRPDSRWDRWKAVLHVRNLQRAAGVPGVPPAPPATREAGK